MLLGIAVSDGCFGSALASIIDIIRVAESVRGQVDEAIPDLELRVAGSKRTVTTSSDMTISTNCGLSDLDVCDMIIVPALGTLTGAETHRRLDHEDGHALVRALRNVDPATTRLAAACTGVFALAESGHIDGRRATTSWFLGPDFRRDYPAIELDLDAMVVADGPALTAGAAFAHIDLALAILRTVSNDLARHVAQLLVIDERPSQAAFMAYDHMQHDDPIVIEFERHIRSTLDQTFDVSVAAAVIGTSRRTLERRVRDVLGLTPLGLVRRLRLERASHLSATTDLTTEDIAQRVGYANAETLRALIRQSQHLVEPRSRSTRG